MGQTSLLQVVKITLCKSIPDREKENECPADDDCLGFFFFFLSYYLRQPEIESLDIVQSANSKSAKWNTLKKTKGMLRDNKQEANMPSQL